MAADLHIHVFSGVTENDLADFFSHTFGSKYFNLARGNCLEASMERVSQTPSVWIGEVSWLKYALTGDDSFVPGTVNAINELIGESLPVLDDKLISQIMKAFKAKNDTGYSLANPKEVKNFLKQHKGERVFTISW